SDSEQNAAIVAALQEWQQDQDHAKFDKFLQQQESKGYLFTQAATGYSIKYAWSENGGTGSRTVLLVSPALKTRNPYMWKQQNSDPAPFSLVELHWQGEEAVLKTSLDGGIEASDGGLLQLRDYDGAATFARMRDDTPNYLKQGS